MKRTSELSSRFNMSLGFIPVVITILLSEFISTDISVYIGAATGLLSTAIYYRIYHPRIVHLILLSSTIILGLFSIIAFTMSPDNRWPQHLLPLTIEMAMILPLLVLLFGRDNIFKALYKNKQAKDFKILVAMAALTRSCIRVFFVLITIHFGLITIGLIFTRSLDNGFMWFMLHIVPAFIFILDMIFGHMELKILQQEKEPELVPVVTPQGEVIGKVDKSYTAENKNEYTHPIIRIAVVSHNMLFLAKRPMDRVIDKGKMDIPLETYLLFKENINTGVERLIKATFPHAKQKLKPEFSIKYKFKNEETDRIVYLFILDLGTDDEIICDPKFENGKLWTFQQIEYNLDQNYFSEMFENEYDHLKLIIETREIYKGS